MAGEYKRDVAYITDKLNKINNHLIGIEIVLLYLVTIVSYKLL